MDRVVIVNGRKWRLCEAQINFLDSGSVPGCFEHTGDTIEKSTDGSYKIYFRKEAGPEGIIPGKSVNGIFVPLDDSRFSLTNPSDGSFLSNFLWGKKSKESTKEVKGYEDLTRILDEALQQATSGKGKERHAGNKPFDKQPIMEIARMTGLAYQTGQAMKKIQESHTLLEIKGKEAAINELRGAIIYLAAAIKTIEEKNGEVR